MGKKLITGKGQQLYRRAKSIIPGGNQLLSKRSEIFLPGLWLFSFAVDPIWATIIGLIWPIGRLRYAFDYYKEAEKRGPGLYFSMPPIYIFVIGSAIGFVLKIFS